MKFFLYVYSTTFTPFAYCLLGVCLHWKLLLISLYLGIVEIKGILFCSFVIRGSPLKMSFSGLNVSVLVMKVSFFNKEDSALCFYLSFTVPSRSNSQVISRLLLHFTIVGCLVAVTHAQGERRMSF